MRQLIDLNSTVELIQTPAIVFGEDFEVIASNQNKPQTEYFKSLLTPENLSCKSNSFEVKDNNSVYDVARLTLEGNVFLFLFRENNQVDFSLDSASTKLYDYLGIIDEYAWETDKNLNFSFLSDKTKAILGFNPEEISGVSIKDIVPYKDWSNLFESMRQHILNGETFSNIIHRAIHKDGRNIWLSTTGIPLFNNNDEFLGLRGVSLDITHEKHALNSLEFSKKNYKLLFEQTPSGVFTYDKNLVIQNCNDAFSEILKAPKEVLLGLDMNTLKDQRVLPAIKDGLAGKKGIYVGDYHTTNSEIDIYISMTCVPLIDNDIVIGGIGLVKDITEAQIIENKLKRQLKFENLALEISNLFINITIEESHPTIDIALSKIGSFLNLESTRLYLLGEKEKVFYAPNYWSSINESKFKRHEVFNIDDYQSVIEDLKSGSVLSRRINDIAKSNKEFTHACNSLVLPILAENKLFGFWELTYKDTDISYDELESEIIILKQVAHTFSSVIARNKKIEQIRLNEKRFESLVLNLSDMITILSKDGRIQYNTKSFYRNTGYSLSVIGKNIGHFIHPNDLKHVLSSFFYIRKKPRSEVSIELRLKKADGSYGFFESFISNLTHIPSVNGIVINSREITDRKNYEQDLYEKQSFISAVSKTIPGYIVVYDFELQKIIYKNRSHEIIDSLFSKDSRVRNIDGKQGDLNDFKRIINSGKFEQNRNFQFRDLDKNGNYSWYNCSVSPFYKEKDGLFKQALVLINDVTEQRQSEITQEVLFKISETARTVKSTGELYKLLFYQLNRLVPLENYYLALSHDGGKTVEFPYQHDTSGSHFKRRLKGGNLTDYVIKTGKALIADNAKLTAYEKKGYFKVKGPIPLSVIASPLKIKKTTIGTIVLYSYNNMVTYTKKHLNTLSFICDEIALSLEKKRYADSLQEEKTIANSIINNLPGIYFLANKHGTLLRWNKNLETIISNTAGNFSSFSIFDLFRNSSEGDLKAKILSVFNNRYTEIETSIDISEKDSIPIILTCMKVMIKGESYISGIGIDITEKTKAELQIQQSLKEKQILLSEVHHRVKNNLAIITGLLNLQQHSQLDEVTRNVLKDSETRIRSMAIIHEKLYQSEIFSTVEIGGYINDLAKYIELVFETNCKINVEVFCDNVYLPLDQAVPFGLIINELFANSYKHAFKGRESGKITVNLTKDKKGQLCLYFIDDGVGFEIKKQKVEKTLGFKLIDGLTHQLSGKSSFSVNNGTTFTLIFSINEKNTHS